MLKFRYSHLLISVFSLGLAMMCATSASADDDTKNLIGGYGSNQQVQGGPMVKLPQDKSIGPEMNGQTLYIQTPINPLTVILSGQDIANFFAAIPNANASADVITNITNAQLSFSNPNNLQVSNTGALTNDIASACAATSNSKACLQQQQAIKQAAAVANVDVNSLLGPLVYQNGQDQAANNFINSIAGLNNPLPMANLVQFAKTQNADVTQVVTQNPTIVSYLNDLRSFAALQSSGVSTLRQMYASRLASKTDPKSTAGIALAALGMPNASPLQIENYMTTRRMTDPVTTGTGGWYAQLSGETTTSLLRMAVALLAENLAEQYNQRLQMERLNATMAIIELQQANSLRTNIQQDLKNINSIPPPSKPQS